MMYALAVLCCLGTLLGAIAEPGVLVRVSQKGLDYAASKAAEVISTKIVGQPLPDYSGEEQAPVGDVNYEMTNVVVASLSIPHSAVTLVPSSSEVRWSLTGASLSVGGNWAYSYKAVIVKVRDSGSFSVSVSGVSMTLTVGLGMDEATGRPTVTSHQCTCVVNSGARVRFRGGASFLYNLFSQFVDRPMRRQLETMMCTAARNAIDVSAASLLTTMKLQVPLVGPAAFDYRLAGEPQIRSGYIETIHTGDVINMNTGRRQTPPVGADKKMVVTEEGDDAMASFYVSENGLNTMGDVLHRQHSLRYRFTERDLSDEFVSLMKVNCPKTQTCFGTLFPKVAAEYSDLSVELEMTSAAAPKFHVQPSGIRALFSSRLVITVRPNGRLPVDLLTLSANITVNFASHVEGERMSAGVVDIIPTVEIVSSQIGDYVPDAALSKLFDVASSQFIVPKLVENAEHGFELPNLEGVRFVNQQVKLLDGAVKVSTDIMYDN